MLIGIDARSIEKNQTGIGRYLSNLLENWTCLNRHNFVLYFKNEVPNLKILEKSCYQKKIIKNPLGIDSNVLFQHYSLPCEAKKDKIDLFFSPAYVLPLFYKGKTVVAIHDISYEIFPENISFADNIFLKIFSRISAKKAAAIITASEFSKTEIVSHYDVSAEKVFVTLLGADKKFFNIRQDRKDKTILVKSGIKENFILSVGTIFNRRHTKSIISAFELIAKKRSDYQLVVIGKNHTMPFVDIDERIKKINTGLNRSAILRFDSVSDSDLLDLYGTAKALIYLSDYEGFGLPPLEAALAKTPVITSAIPAIKEVMGENTALFIKNNNDIKEIVDAFEVIIDGQGQKINLVDNAFNRAKIFSWSDCAKNTIEIFEKI